MNETVNMNSHNDSTGTQNKNCLAVMFKKFILFVLNTELNILRKKSESLTFRNVHWYVVCKSQEHGMHCIPLQIWNNYTTRSQ